MGKLKITDLKKDIYDGELIKIEYSKKLPYTDAQISALVSDMWLLRI